jgi:hypothetical protein
MMDSTFLGVLAGISLQLSNGAGGAPPLELLNASPRISETLDNLGVSFLFKFGGSSGPLSDKFEPLARGAPASAEELARTCLKAHQTLMALNPENAQRFKDVAQFLAEDLQRLELGQNR